MKYYTFFFPFKIVKIILISWAIQKQKVCWIWLEDYCTPILALFSSMYVEMQVTNVYQNIFLAVSFTPFLHSQKPLSPPLTRLLPFRHILCPGHSLPVPWMFWNKKSTHVRKKSHPLQFFINPTSLNECKAPSLFRLSLSVKRGLANLLRPFLLQPWVKSNSIQWGPVRSSGEAAILRRQVSVTNTLNV